MLWLVWWLLNIDSEFVLDCKLSFRFCPIPGNRQRRLSLCPEWWSGWFSQAHCPWPLRATVGGSSATHYMLRLGAGALASCLSPFCLLLWCPLDHQLEGCSLCCGFLVDPWAVLWHQVVPVLAALQLLCFPHSPSMLLPACGSLQALNWWFLQWWILYWLCNTCIQGQFKT